MSLQKQTNLSAMSQHYGLALEEIKLERSIKNMTSLLDGEPSSKKFNFLLSEIERQEKALRALQELRQHK